MHIKLNSEKDVTQSKLNKILELLKKNTVLLNRADFCGHCHHFQPEFNRFASLAKLDKVNVVELESAALHTIQKKDPKLYTKITAKDGLYFPMVIIFARKSDKTSKSIYNGERNAASLKIEVDKKMAVKKKT